MLKKTKITEGCYIVCSDNTSVLFGCPSDIVKVFWFVGLILSMSAIIFGVWL